MKCSLLIGFVAKLSLIVVGIHAPVTVLHAGTQTGKVEWVISRASDGLTYFKLIGNKTVTGCGTEQYWIIRAENSDSGKRQLAIIMAAHASRGTLFVSGQNSCLRWTASEDVDYVQWVAPPG